MEVLVALAVFVFVTFSLTVGLIQMLRITGDTRDRAVATSLARTQIENLRLLNSTGHALVPTSNYPSSFTVTVAMTPSATSTCSTGSSRQVTVTVSWGTGGTHHSVSDDSELAC